MKYRILSLDGGGSWALIQVRTLQQLYGEHATGHSVLSHFNLVVANSGGSLVTAALAENLRLSQIVALFRSRGIRRKIFSELTFGEKLDSAAVFRVAGIAPQYSAVRKWDALVDILPRSGGRYLKDLAQDIARQHNLDDFHFLISAYDYDRNRAIFFRSNENSRADTHVLARELEGFTSDAFINVTLAQAIHASSNAPINYFNAPAKFPFKGSHLRRYFWDGAVAGYNNPLMAGVTEAFCNGHRAGDIAVLSLGTGSEFLPLKLAGDPAMEHVEDYLSELREENDFREDLKKMMTSILSDPPDAATFIAYSMLYPALPVSTPMFIRMNPLIQPVWSENQGWQLPPPFKNRHGKNDRITIDDFKRLRGLDLDVIQDEDIELIDRFCDGWFADAVPNQPIRSDSRMRPLLGYGKFSEAIDAAKQGGAFGIQAFPV